jgi:hypothetical protein
MKTLQNNFTTPEQSKRLLELGVPADSTDCYYGKDGKIHHIDGSIPYSLLWQTGCVPCWSVGRMIEIWEKCTCHEFDRWTQNGVFLPLIDDCIEHIRFAVNPDTYTSIDFSKLEE